MKIRIGTRGSQLALAQAHWVAVRMREAHSGNVEPEVVVLKTRGDKLQHLSLAKLDDKGFFTREIEVALLDGRIDVAVHSLKDLPSEQPVGLALGAIPTREDPADLLLLKNSANTESGVPAGSRIGTSSIRRQLQAQELGDGLQLTDIRGNVPTRISLLREGRIDGVLLASAGVRRLGLDLGDLVVRRLDPNTFVPAPGQGALGLQIRVDDAQTRDLLQPLHDVEIAAAVEAERWLLQRVGGGCNLPLGAWVRKEGEDFVFSACLGPRGWRPGAAAQVARATAKGPDPMELARQVWNALSTSWQEEPVGVGVRVLLTGSQSVAERQAQAMRHAGIGVLVAPLILTEVALDEEGMEAALSALTAQSWIVLTSPMGAAAFLDRISVTALSPTIRFAAIGPSTAREIRQRGLDVSWTASEANSEGFVAEFPPCGEGETGEHFLLPCAEGARSVISDALKACGHSVTLLPFYRTRPAPSESVRAALETKLDFVVFSSPSAVAAFCSLDLVLQAVPVALGPTTARAVAEAGLPGALVPEQPGPEALTSLILAAAAHRMDG